LFIADCLLRPVAASISDIAWVKGRPVILRFPLRPVKAGEPFSRPLWFSAFLGLVLHEEAGGSWAAAGMIDVLIKSDQKDYCR